MKSSPKQEFCFIIESTIPAVVFRFKEEQIFCLNQKSCLNQKATVQLCDGKKEDVQGLRMTPNQLASAPPLLDKNLSVSCITLFEDSNCTIESIRIIDGVI